MLQMKLHYKSAHNLKFNEKEYRAQNRQVIISPDDFKKKFDLNITDPHKLTTNALTHLDTIEKNVLREYFN